MCGRVHRRPQYVVVGLASRNNQGLVQDDAAICSNLIRTGQWVGADKFQDWDRIDGVSRVCLVHSMSDSAGV